MKKPSPETIELAVQVFLALACSALVGQMIAALLKNL